ncbi:MAG: FlgD immunoglobulin-like domain containing protein [Candidatus Cloacimonetes bacterium]|nr:FlgD immunoglobulin-like domain containing protein [Candidatus Cloacimonadota bacterium]
MRVHYSILLFLFCFLLVTGCSKTTGLEENFENRPSVNFHFYIGEHDDLKIFIRNSILEIVKVTTTETNSEPGVYSVSWNGKNHRDKPVASGVYYYSIVTDGNESTNTMILLK